MYCLYCMTPLCRYAEMLDKEIMPEGYLEVYVLPVLYDPPVQVR